MPQYRIFTLRDDGHIAGPSDIIDCLDDRAAVREAKQTLNEKAIEIWDGPRRIAKLDPG
jgi:hypothetical protein